MSEGLRTYSNIYFTLIALLFSICVNAQKDSTGGNDSKIFTFVEHVPEFPGGDMGVIKFLQQNIKYPKRERNKDIQGKVIVRFVVDIDGSVKDVVVVNSVSPGLDKEAVRVVKLLPKFKPGTQQGKPVMVYYNLPIKFSLN
ncbi:MAG: family metallopeptidase [Bacteroidota bacterium]|nr:family metallopeptidase [Bacteroidota bacterium]